MNRLPRWRIAAAVLILAGLIAFLGMFAPIYFRNLELQKYVSGLTRTAANAQKSDDLLRTWVLDKAHQLNLPVAEDNVPTIVRRFHGGAELPVAVFDRSATNRLASGTLTTLDNQIDPHVRSSPC